MMQNWKIKKMSRKLIITWLSAINTLIDSYLDKEVCDEGCPLCGLDEEVDCRGCLWLIIEGKDCFDFAYKNDFNNGPKRYDMRWQTLRIPMLRRWKKILKIELARRAE